MCIVKPKWLPRESLVNWTIYMWIVRGESRVGGEGSQELCWVLIESEWVRLESLVEH